MELNLRITPNSKEFGLGAFNAQNKTLKLKIKSKPFKGKANQEIEKKLSEFFEEKIQIISGKKSKNKKIFIPNKEMDEILNLLKK